MRVSTDDQDLSLQIDSLTCLGIDQENIFAEKISGAKTDRPQLDACLAKLQQGDTLVVCRLDRLGRSMHHLVELIEDLRIGVGTLAFNSFSGLGRPGTGVLKVEGKVVATKRMEKTLPMTLQWDESFDIGSDTLTGVNDADYQPPFAFTGTLSKLTLKVDRPQLSTADNKTLEKAMKKAAAGRE